MIIRSPIDLCKILFPACLNLWRKMAMASQEINAKPHNRHGRIFEQRCPRLGHIITPALAMSFDTDCTLAPVSRVFKKWLMRASLNGSKQPPITESFTSSAIECEFVRTRSSGLTKNCNKIVPYSKSFASVRGGSTLAHLNFERRCCST